MKNIIILSALILASSFVIATPNNDNGSNATFTATELVQATGTVIMKGDIWIIRVSNNDGVVDYAPLNLPSNYQRVGLVVQFSGKIKYISDTDRLAGVTLIITQIRPVK